mmetsp:Transcript_13149/g.16608  ORF Transcript_13149/g.16608 Transcript_13149/m.16608 type:complete len:112 (-) Transcript_13149:335-670(-)
MNFSAQKQVVKPPQRGIFPLDHDGECRDAMRSYLSCLKTQDDSHHKCRDLSREYLQCRMDRELMAKEDLNTMGFSPSGEVRSVTVMEDDKEGEGFVAGKHIQRRRKWFWQD